MGAGRSGGKSPVVIKRYGGERLYDTRAATYVTLADLRCMEEDGIRVVVYDAITGDNITRALLTPLH